MLQEEKIPKREENMEELQNQALICPCCGSDSIVHPRDDPLVWKCVDCGLKSRY